MEQLIEEIRTRPVIWDTTREIYRDAVLKDKAWTEVAEVLSKDKLILKQDWKKLKDCHRQAITRRRTTTGQAATKIKKWKYEDQMKFLLGTMQHRPSDTNIPLPNADQAENNVNQEQVDDGDDDLGSVAGEDDTIEEMPATQKERRNRSPRGVDKVLNFMKEKEKSKSERNKTVPDEIDLFFASTAQSVKKLPRRLQNRVKIEILNVINKAEEDHETLQPTISASLPPTGPRVYPQPFLTDDLSRPSTSTNSTHSATSDTGTSSLYDNDALSNKVFFNL